MTFLRRLSIVIAVFVGIELLAVVLKKALQEDANAIEQDVDEDELYSDAGPWAESERYRTA